MPEENIVRTQECHHVEEGELVLMDQGRGREGPGQEVESRGRSAGVETLEPLQCLPSVDRKHSHVSRGEQEGGQAAEQLGGRVASFHHQACCWVPLMSSGHPAGYNRVEGLSVTSDPSCDAGKVGASRGAQDTNMLSL